MSTPLVSINMPVHNGERFIKAAIQSILNQTFEDFELVIINDNSTDNTVQIIDSFTDKRIQLYHNNEKTGLAKVRNKGFGLSKGKYIAMLDSDDIAYPDRLEKQVKYLEANKECCLVFCWTDFIDEAGNRFGGEQVDYPDKAISSVLFFHNCIAQSSVMLRKDMLASQLPYDESLIIGEDYDLWIRLAKKYPFHLMKETLVKYRQHENNTSQSIRPITEEFVRNIFKKQWEALGIKAITSDELSLHLSMIHNCFSSDKFFIGQLNKLYSKMVQENRNRKVYPKIWFEGMIKMYMNKTLLGYFEKKRYNFSIIRDLFGNHLNGAYYLPTKTVIKFLYKIVFSYGSKPK